MGICIFMEHVVLSIDFQKLSETNTCECNFIWKQSLLKCSQFKELLG